MKKKRFICWYAFQGMETEGRLELIEPKIFEAEDIAEAMWKYHHSINDKWGEMFYNNDLESYRNKGEFTVWGFNCEELAN